MSLKSGQLEILSSVWTNVRDIGIFATAHMSLHRALTTRIDGV